MSSTKRLRLAVLNYLENTEKQIASKSLQRLMKLEQLFLIIGKVLKTLKLVF